MSKVDVFVTYSWDDKTDEKIYSFVDFLRDEGGVNAECDRLKTQKESASSFTQVMNDGLKFPKVIVVLSESYKKKAENGEGGVGIEYRIISSDIAQNPKKYIFVSFESLNKEVITNIVPKMYESYEIIDLYKDENNNYRKLFSKLFDEPEIEFSPVSEKTHKIEKIKPKPFTVRDINKEVKKNDVEDME